MSSRSDWEHALLVWNGMVAMPRTAERQAAAADLRRPDDAVAGEPPRPTDAAAVTSIPDASRQSTRSDFA